MKTHVKRLIGKLDDNNKDRLFALLLTIIGLAAIIWL